MMRITHLLPPVRKTFAVVLCCTFLGTTTEAQAVRSIQPTKADVPALIRPYFAPEIPPVRLANSPRLSELVRAGKLYLTVQDAIALALENNIDIEVARYNPIIDRWRLERTRAGGALPGVPSGSSQASFVQAGQGVAGAQQAAGVSTANRSNNGNNAANATITQVGPVTQTLDPVVQNSNAFTHRTTLEADPVLSGTPTLIGDQRAYTASVQKGFLLGGSATLNYTSSHLQENAASDFLNPQVAPVLSLQLQQPFLQGFGVAVNSRTIVAAERTLESDPLTFKAQVIAVTANVLNLYYGLVADYEDVRAKQSALDVARQFLENNKKQVQLGALAPLDVTTADAQVAASEQALIVSQTSLLQQEVQLKNVLSRRGLRDPVLANAQIIPIDRIVVPEKEDLPPLQDLVETALKSRTDVALQKVNYANAETSALGTANGVLPRLQGFATLKQSGQAGSPNPLNPTQLPDPYFVGSLGTALGQVFRRNFPSQSGGAFLSGSLRNRQAQADYGIDQLTLRTTQLQDQKTLNQVVVDVSNYVTALRQARARYEAAVKSRVLAEQLLSAEQKKFALGASTPFNVVQQQRDLATAQATEVSGLVTYSNASVALQQALGTILEKNNISLEEATRGRVTRQSSLPEKLPQQP
ncbi:MAG TPA: TolC family protein [Bryobacteraceae bacterium]